jgi:dolichyl-phosphate-mannose-protein mannosyltransferase
MTAPTRESAAVPAERVVPVVSPGALVPIADFGPVDTVRGWIVTGVITLLAAVTRFLNLGSPTDAGTPIFDEKHYAPQAWQVLHNHGVEPRVRPGGAPAGRQAADRDRRGHLRL